MVTLRVLTPQSLYLSYRMPRERGGLGADLYFSTEQADEHRIKVLATQCFGGADLPAQKGQKLLGRIVDLDIRGKKVNFAKVNL